MNNYIVEIKELEDLKLFDEKFNFLYKNNQRIPKEEFQNYDIYRRNLDKLISSNKVKENIEDKSEVVESNKLTEKERMIDKFFNKIFNIKEDIAIDEMTHLMDNLYNNLPFSKILIDRLILVYKTSSYIEIPNYQNFHHMCNIMISILNNIDLNNDFFDINFAIIYIAEKTYHINPKNKFNKIYLCSSLSKNRIVTNKSFWIKLMEIKIDSLKNQLFNKDNKLNVKEEKKG
jgi:hypothetical protein